MTDETRNSQGSDPSSHPGVDYTETQSDSSGSSRRYVLQAGGTLAGAVLSGCSGRLPFIGGGSNTTETTPSLAEFRGSGPLGDARDVQAPRISDLPELSGSLRLYLGGGEGGLYVDLLELFEQVYPDFRPEVNSAPSSSLANTIIEEKKGGKSPADVFWSVDAGSLGVVARAGHTETLPKDVVKPVPENFHPDRQWVGVAGRARAIPYNTRAYDAADIPDDIHAFSEDQAFGNAMGWAPTYSAFQAFVTAMRVLEGDETTKQWLRGMLDQGVTRYRNEWFVSNNVADGAVQAGFANHYYAMRVKAARENAPVDLAFTTNDAGALINTSGAAIVTGTDKQELGTRFVRHLLSAEAQEFFATRTFAYPMVSGVPPVGGLPRIDELKPPDIPLTKLSDLQPTLDLLREVGLL